MLESSNLHYLHSLKDPRIYMSLASDKLDTIRQQVQYHLDKAEESQLTPAQERSLCDAIKARLRAENALMVVHAHHQIYVPVLLDSRHQDAQVKSEITGITYVYC